MPNTAALSNSGDKTEKTLASSLGELVQASKNLPRRSNGVGSLRRSLAEIRRRAVDMRKYNKEGAKRNPYSKVHYLMMGKGITIEDMEDELRSIDVRPVGSDASAVVPGRRQAAGKAEKADGAGAFGDVGDYMAAQRHESILSAIEQSLSTSARDFDRFVSDNVSAEWKKSTRNVESALQSILKPAQQPQALAQGQAPQPQPHARTFDKEKKTALAWRSRPSTNILSAQYTFEDVGKDASSAARANPNVSLALRRKFELYAQVVYNLNEARQAGHWYPICTVFADLAKHEMTTRAKQMHEAWMIVRDVCGEGDAEREEAKQRRVTGAGSANSASSTSASRPARLEERKFARAYTGEEAQLRQKIVARSRAYLEEQFLDHVTELYAKVAGGAAPASNAQKVQKFVELTRKGKNGKWKVENLTFVNLVPIWATLFYLMRAGCYDEALALVESNVDGFQKLERSFPLYMRAYCASAAHALPADLHGRLANEFNQYFRRLGAQKMDPYKYAVYKLIGRCDLARRDLPSVALTTEDWLWYHLGLVRESGSAGADVGAGSAGAVSAGSADSASSAGADGAFDGPLQPEIYRLADLQQAVVSLGASAFDGSRSNPLYLQVLLLTGQYERAVKHVFESSEMDAVHLAVGLAYYGLLRVAVSAGGAESTLGAPDAPAIRLMHVSAQGVASIDFPRLVGHYVRAFKLSDPRVAAEYLVQICMCQNTQNSGLEKQQIAICQQAVRDLVLETREFVILLGRIDKSGSRVPGVVEKRRKLLCLDDSAAFLHNIAEKAARSAEQEGRPYDCILLYQLAEEYETVLATVNVLLGDFAAAADFRTPLGPVVQADRILGEANIVKLARRLLKMYSGSAEMLARTSASRRHTCDALLQLIDLFVDFTSSAPDLVDILARVKSLGLTPCSPDLSMDQIRAKADEFSALDEPLARCVPNMLIVQMSCISQLLYDLQQGIDAVRFDRLAGSQTNGSKDEKIRQLRLMSKYCMVYAGMVQYKMPQEVYRTLVSLEADV